jgi:hypothetical protein
VSCCCYKLAAEALGQFGNPVEEERPPLEAVTRKLMKTQEAKEISVCDVVWCGELQRVN